MKTNGMNDRTPNIIYCNKIEGFSSLFPIFPKTNLISLANQFRVSLIHKIKRQLI